MAYLVMVHATFANKADADHIYNQAKAVATTASVARIGEAGERTSHCGVFYEQADGTLVKDRQWHIDRFGIVRETDPVPDDVVPEWVQPVGAQDAYPMTDVFGLPTKVKIDGVTCTPNSDVNTQDPRVGGWTPEGGTTTGTTETVPAWQTWSGLNEDLYQIGDRVTHNGSTWEATAGNNHWEPGVFGWMQL